MWFASCSGSPCWFVGIATGGQHSNLPLPFCRWGNFVPIHIFLPLEYPGFGVLILWGVWIGGCSCVTVLSLALLLGGISQSFLTSISFLTFSLLWATGYLCRLGHLLTMGIVLWSLSLGLLILGVYWDLGVWWFCGHLIRIRPCHSFKTFCRCWPLSLFCSLAILPNFGVGIWLGGS